MKFLDYLEEWIITFMMGAATLLIFVAVLHRYAAGVMIPGLQDALLRIDLTWAQELCIYMFVWMAKFGAAYGVRTGIHVGVDVMINRLPPALHKAYVLFGMTAGAVFTVIVGSLGAKFTYEIAQTSSTSPDLEIPKWIVYLCIPLGSYLMCFRFIQVAVHFARTGDLPHHNVAHVDGIEPIADINPYNMADNLHPASAGAGKTK